MEITEKKKILLVEDEVIVAMTEKSDLENIGYSVTHVINGEEAVSYALDYNNHFDIILMDIDLGSGIDGTETAEQILSSKDIPIVFLSSHVEPHIVKRTEKITSYGYLVKNSNLAVIDASIKMAFRLHEAKIVQKENEEKFRRIYENVSIAIAQVSLNFTIEHANEAYCNMLGYTEDELIGKTLKDITHKEVVEENLHKQKMLAEGKIEHFHLDKKFIHKNGRTVYGILDANLIRDENDQPSYFLGSVVNITERKDTEEKHKFLFENMTQGVVYHSPTGEILQSNEAANQILGLEKNKLNGKNPSDKRWQALNENNTECPTEQHPVSITIKTKNPVRNKVMGVFIPEKNSYRWINVNSTPCFFDGTDKIKHVLVTFENITKRKEAENKLIDELAEKELILKEVHHRIKNNISSIGILIKMQLRQIENKEAKSILNEALNRIESMRLIYEKLLISDDYSEISVSDYLSDLLTAIENSFPPNNNIKINKSIDNFIISIKEIFLLGIIINELITNSVKYAFDKIKKPEIEITFKKNNSTIELFVSDNGIGIPEKLESDTPGGFGISLIKLLVKQLKGNIAFSSDRGTECRITYKV